MQYSRSLSLRQNFSWIFVGNLVYAGCQWGFLVILAKMGTPEMVGQFALGFAIATPVMLLLNLQLRAVQATDAEHQYEFQHYLMVRLMATLLAGGIIGAIVYLSGFTQETATVVLIISLAKAIEAISDVMYGCLQQHERMDWIGHSLILRGLTALLALSMGFLLAGLSGAVWGLALAWGFVLLGHDLLRVEMVLSSRRSRSMRDSGQWRSPLQPLMTLTKVAFPLGLAGALISLNANIPRYFVESSLGQEALGIFAAMTYLPIAGTMLITALGHATIPRLSKYYTARNYAAFWQLLRTLVGIGAGMGVLGVAVAIALGKVLLTVLYRPEYAAHTDIFVWVMVSAAIGYIGNYLGYGITATRNFEQFTIPYLLTTGFSSVVSWYMIPSWGLLGAAWTLCLINLASCFAPIFILLKVRKYHEPTA